MIASDSSLLYLQPLEQRPRLPRAPPTVAVDSMHQINTTARGCQSMCLRTPSSRTHLEKYPRMQSCPQLQAGNQGTPGPELCREATRIALPAPRRLHVPRRKQVLLTSTDSHVHRRILGLQLLSVLAYAQQKV